MILPSKFNNRIGSVMVSVLASSVVDRGFEPRSGPVGSSPGRDKPKTIKLECVASPLGTHH
jgi:hypothetical protein